MSGPQILLLEDDAAIREGLVECLELEGYSVQAVVDGAEALAWLEGGHRPRLVVLDLVMPRMSGEEFLREVRADGALRQLPVVLMTAASPGNVALPACDALLVKPFELDELLQVIRRFLR
jgi:two-component system, chemotaxis family, chemotaxis protein CheY